MIKAIKGAKDLFYDEVVRWQALEKLVREIFENFNYSEIRTPVFEETRLFARSIGEETDIVSKEMYTFTDKSGLSITLRPEMTASVVRAFIEHSLGKQFNLNKFYYIAPMFRQERPQAGRLRQFHQFGAEALGSSSPSLDAEMIILAYEILKQLGLKKLSVKINSLGSPAEREEYRKVLREYLKPHYDKLSETSKVRFEKNVLRIFDSKDERDIEIMKDAPRLLDSLGEESSAFFEEVKELLSKAGVEFETDTALVRGLDYYTHTTFEIVSESVGAQSALCGGGRYDLLAEQLGGTPTPGVGFAAGMERILLACANEEIEVGKKEKVKLYIVRIEKELKNKAFELALFFRRHGIKTELDYLSRSVKAQMREANRIEAEHVLILGGEEFLKNEAVLKNMSDGSQKNVSLANLEAVLKEISG